MANPNDPQLMEQKKALSGQIDTLKQQLQSDPNNESLKANLADLERQEKSLNDQLKTSRDTARQDQPRGKSEQARANAPGQQKKGQ